MSISSDILTDDTLMDDDIVIKEPERQAMSDLDVHKDLHSEQGTHNGEHPGRAANPTVEVHDISWLEFPPSSVGAQRTAVRFT